MDYTSISDHLQHPVSLNKFLALSRGERNENLHSNFVKPSISTQQKRNKQKQVLPTTKWLFRCLAAAPLPIYCDAPEAMRQLAKPLRKEEKKNFIYWETLFGKSTFIWSARQFWPLRKYTGEYEADTQREERGIPWKNKKKGLLIQKREQHGK